MWKQKILITIFVKKLVNVRLIQIVHLNFLFVMMEFVIIFVASKKLENTVMSNIKS